MKRIFSAALAATCAFGLHAQKGNVDFVEYDLDNGMHVILHEDNSTPIVAVSVLYHVGSKNESPDRTGFAHFFEHLMFEGSENIDRGEFDQYIERNGGTLNANTSQDRTYYYEIFSSNNLELGLWLESERLLHAKVDNVGIETQREVVKEEKRQRVDNQPYGSFMASAFDLLYDKHPYQWTPIGSMEHLDAAQEEDFINFYKTFYVPSNATLSIAGDIDIEEAKILIDKYFGSIPKGQAINLYRDYLNLDNDAFTAKYGKGKAIFNEKDFFNTTSKDGMWLINEYKKKETVIPRPDIVEPKLEKEIVDTVYDNIQLPAVFIGYHSPRQNTKEAYALEMLNAVISGGTSARMNKNIVEEKELAVSAFSFAFPLEDPGIALFAGIAAKDVEIDSLKEALEVEINKVKNELVSEVEFEKVKNQFENDFYSSNSSVAGKAESLANNYVYFDNTNLINEQLSVYDNITREDLMAVAKKYFTEDARLVLYYLPKK
ncbi:M16 family metallopeptidase [Brumimicrobium aurantiacum]|nr:pitrilysin family protein [Brumimicrobium aurantiacum]